MVLVNTYLHYSLCLCIGEVELDHLSRLYQVMMVDELSEHFSNYPELNNVLLIT